MIKQQNNRPHEDAEDFARAIGKALQNGDGMPLPADITARLANARVQALAIHQQQMRIRQQNAGTPAKAARKTFSWWQRALAAVPIAAAGAGAVFMQGAVSDDGLIEAIATDVQILSQDVPPRAYADQGFMEFLKTYQPAADVTKEASDPAL